MRTISTSSLSIRLICAFVLALALVPAAACSRSPAPSSSSPPAGQPASVVEIDEGATALFRERGLDDGAFVLLDLHSRATTIVNPRTAEARFSPCSTFKIPSTLIGLETGVITGERFSLEWDGTKYEIEAWNRDHDLASAMRDSVVWFYQEVARRVGQPRMDRWVHAFRYGNQDTSGGIDRFWLEDTLRISPREQVDFLRRMRAGALPVRAENEALVERLIILEEGRGWTWRGKTGLGVQDGRTIGWLVGFVDRGERSYAYAFLGLAPESEIMRVRDLRRPLTRALLERRGVAPSPPAVEP